MSDLEELDMCSIERNPIANHKQACRAIAPAGWAYGGFDNGYYFFQSGSYGPGFKEMKCVEEDLTAKNLQLMADLNVSR